MDGVVNFLKPPGMTSSDAVFDLRKLFGERRAGHLGTLDPAAAGVLPVCFGRATRLFDLLVDKEKEYVFETAFGTQTDTQDACGTVTARNDRTVERSELEALLPSMLGWQMQQASIYSALKVGGKKMYELARAGQSVEPKSREIEITELELLAETDRNHFLLRAVCSRGTYVRSLAESIARRLGTVAYVPFLLRTRSGPFRIESARTLAELEEMAAVGALASTLISCEEAAAFLPELALDADRAAPTKNGLETNGLNTPEGLYRAYAAGEFLGVGRIENGAFRLTIHLYQRVP